MQEVRNWALEIFESPEIADNFERQEINGRTLQSQRILEDKSMDVLGLNTIGKKDKFASSLTKLRDILSYNLLDYWYNYK